MKIRTFALFAAALAGATVATAGTVYDNTFYDTLNTTFYSVGEYTQIGDSITLGGVERHLTVAEVQFFNSGAPGTFDATLRFWQLTNGRVGAQIGFDFVQTGLSIGTVDILTVQFPGLDLTVPDSIAFSIEISPNLDTLDLGLNMFNGSGGANSAPDTGSSDLSQILVRTNSGLVAGDVPAGSGNLYFRLEADQPVPEPSTIFLVGTVLIGLGAFRRWRQRGE